MRSTLDHSVTAARSDSEIVARSLVEPNAFGDLVGRHLDPIFRYVAARVGPASAEDVVAETFAIAFDRRGQFDTSADSARPWLYGIAANRLHKHREAERRWLERASLERVSSPDPEERRADARIDAGRLAPVIAQALLDLSVAERDVLLLHALEDMSHEQIATALGIRPGAAKTRLSRGRAKLRERLAHLDPSRPEGVVL